MGEENCCMGACSRCWCMTTFVTGLLILLNQFWLMWSWWSFIGGLLVLYGLLGMIWPKCPHCMDGCCVLEKKEKAKSKK